MPTDREKRKKFDDLRAQLDRRGYGEERRQRVKKDLPESEIRRAVKRERSPARPSTPRGDVVYRRDIPRQEQTIKPETDPRPAVDLQEAVQGTEIVCAGRTGYLCTTNVAEIQGAEDMSLAFRDRLTDRASDLCSHVEPVCDPGELTPGDVIFMDVESTGLGSSPLFLIGVMIWDSDRFIVKQFLARDYAEETAVINMFLDECKGRKLLVTFNGKSFDFPYIRMRSVATGLRFGLDPFHLDLLHVCRRIWRRSLPDCKLQTLEKHICRRTRRGDIPGSEIPDAYHAYVRTGNARQVVEILKHNMLDLVTLADLMVRLPRRQVSK